jgi:hypothetical protein
VTCQPNRCTVPIMNSSLSRRPSQARWRVSCRSPGRAIDGSRATRQVRGHHRIVVIRRSGTTRDGMGSGRHPTSTDGRWPTGCYRSSPASGTASSWSSARVGLARADLAGRAHPAHPPADEPARRRASGVHRRDLPPRLQQLRLAGELAEVRAPVATRPRSWGWVTSRGRWPPTLAWRWRLLARKIIGIG